ncbi:hypothetical protein MtrunA17_Chr6g0464801 [Medicago truncatula]|uniref:Uncharacterized protein n=1 Tax=Medicago truncatula TaxID=3880 RepID=A0A396HH06_MEDTR|nr:hypothetical protein MtrunA17_Chr6g0464801 [Medicago truncatula]
MQKRILKVMMMAKFLHVQNKKNVQRVMVKQLISTLIIRRGGQRRSDLSMGRGGRRRSDLSTGKGPGINSEFL